MKWLIVILSVLVLSSCSGADPEAEANKLLVQLSGEIDEAVKIEDIGQKYVALQKAQMGIQALIAEYPETSVAVMIATNQKIGMLTKSELDSEVASLSTNLEVCVSNQDARCIFNYMEFSLENAPEDQQLHLAFAAALLPELPDQKYAGQKFNFDIGSSDNAGAQMSYLLGMGELLFRDESDFWSENGTLFPKIDNSENETKQMNFIAGIIGMSVLGIPFEESFQDMLNNSVPEEIKQLDLPLGIMPGEKWTDSIIDTVYKGYTSRFVQEWSGTTADGEQRLCEINDYILQTNENIPRLASECVVWLWRTGNVTNLSDLLSKLTPDDEVLWGLTGTALVAVYSRTEEFEPTPVPLQN